jgi:hypothetical protein
MDDNSDNRRLDRIEHKIDSLYELNVEQSNILVRHEILHERNTESIVEHVRRTNLLEAQMEEALKPIEWARMTGRILLWISAAIIPILALYYTLKQ